MITSLNMGEQVLYKLDGRVARVTLNRPDKLNALYGTMREELLASLDRAARESRAVIVTGAGSGFCAGGDIQFMGELREREDGDAFRALVEAGKRVVSRLTSLPIPTIAAVHGVAAGAGLSLALACDFRIATESARLGASFARIGLSADWGASYFLTRMLGRARAVELLLTGRMLTAGEAENLGLVGEVLPSDRFEERVTQAAEALADAAPKSVAHLKRLIHDAEQLSLDECLNLERDAQLACFQSGDALEGIRAFQEKRKPRFTGD